MNTICRIRSASTNKIGIKPLEAFALERLFLSLQEATGMNERFGFLSAVHGLLYGGVCHRHAAARSKHIASDLVVCHLHRIIVGISMPAGAFAAMARPERKSIVKAAYGFAVLYAVLINIAYFTQLTLVHSKGLSEPLLQSFTYAPGTWMFNLDLYGYGLLALSTFFLGFSIKPIGKAQKWLKGLLLAHGVFAPFCMLSLQRWGCSTPCKARRADWILACWRWNSGVSCLFPS